MITLDTSALIKLVLEEENSDVAREIYKKELAMRERILVPYLVLPESLNKKWKYKNHNNEQIDEKF